jgi:hypothetical protein
MSCTRSTGADGHGGPFEVLFKEGCPTFVDASQRGAADVCRLSTGGARGLCARRG